MTFTTLTARQAFVAADFLKTAQANGISYLRVAFPASHPLIKGNKASQIRRVTDAIADGFDELGNRVRLTPDLRVIQG